MKKPFPRLKPPAASHPAKPNPPARSRHDRIPVRILCHLSYAAYFFSNRFAMHIFRSLISVAYMTTIAQEHVRIVEEV